MPRSSKFLSFFPLGLWAKGHLCPAVGLRLPGLNRRPSKKEGSPEDPTSPTPIEVKLLGSLCQPASLSTRGKGHDSKPYQQHYQLARFRQPEKAKPRPDSRAGC